ncbi:MAG: helix-turn-helix domain-containing protein [bacterium]
MNQTGWHFTKAAESLGIDRSTLFRKMKKLGIKKI